MKKLFLSFITSCFLLSISTSFATDATKKATLCYEDQDYPPYLIGDSNQPPERDPGVLVELSKITFENAGFSVEYLRRPWKRCMRMIEDGKVAAMFGVIYLPAREQVGVYPKKEGKIDYSRRLLSVDYPVFKHKASSPIWDGKSFSQQHIKLGTPLGYATVKSLEDEHGIEPNVAFLPEAGLKLVSQNKLDGYIVEKRVGLSILRKQNISNVVIPQSPPFKRHDLYLFMSHKFYQTHQKQAEEIWSHLAVLRETKLDKMLKKYLKKQ